MASKRSAGSNLDFFSKKSKAQPSSLSTQEIPLVDFSNLSTSSQDENTEISSAIKISTLVETSNLSNLNNVLDNNLKHENQDEIFDSSNVSLNTNNPTSLLQPTNLVISYSSDQKALISKCDLSCCNSSDPYHPITKDELALTVQNRVFCYPCRVAFERGIHPNNTSTLNPTCKSFLAGYCDWKNALPKFKVHERSTLHCDSIYIVNQQGKLSVREQLTLATRQQQEQRRQALIIQISCITFLLRQGLALRGHSDENSNLIQLLKLRTIDNNFLKQWIDEKKYLSHDIIDELCKEIYLTILRDIVKEISNRKWFSLICDETTDESTLSQLCITIRSIDNNYNVFEDVIGLHEISRQNAPTIVEAILDTLTRCGLDIANCRGQSYDGASNMSGIYDGVSALILKQQGKAIHVHCNTHCLDLAIQDLTGQCTTICSCLSFVKDIIDFIRRSPKRLSIIKEISNQITMPYTTLTPLCPTRWTMRAESCSSLLENYGLVQETLYTISDEKGGCGIKANGLYEQMNRFNIFFGLKLAYLILIDTAELSRVIQDSSCCLQDVLCAAETVINYFIRIQDDNHFSWFYNGVINDSEGLTEKPVLPRQRRPAKPYESNSRVSDFTTCEEFYHRQYIEALDIVVNMLHVRFAQSNFKLLCDVEKFILNVSNNPVDDPDDLIQGIREFCDGDIDIQRLKAEVHMIYDFAKYVINTNQMKIKQITKISTICEILNSYNVGKQMFREFDKLIKLYLTLPVTTASAKRAFSTLNRLKTVLRNSMTQSRLNHCLLANIYEEKLDEIDPYQIMSKFIASNTNRQAFFGSVV